MGKFKDKVVIITGVGSGIGRIASVGFASEGAKLAICDLRPDALEETVRRCKQAAPESEVLSMVCDITEYENIVAFTDRIAKEYGKVDVLINNAYAAEMFLSFLDHTTEQLDTAVKTIIYAGWHMMKLCFPLMKDHGASIINYGSAGACQGQTMRAAYSLAKGAIMTLTRCVANEWGEYGIRVNNFVPMGITDTQLNYPEELKNQVMQASAAMSPFKRCGDVEKDLLPVIFFLAGDGSRWITGQDIHAEGGSDIHW